MPNSAPLEGRRDLVLQDVRLHARADLGRAFLEVADAADIDADAGVELQRAAAGRGLGAAEYHADLLADPGDRTSLRLPPAAEAIAAIDRPVSARLERDLGGFPALGADGREHFPRPA